MLYVVLKILFLFLFGELVRVMFFIKHLGVDVLEVVIAQVIFTVLADDYPYANLWLWLENVTGRRTLDWQCVLLIVQFGSVVLLVQVNVPAIYPTKNVKMLAMDFTLALITVAVDGPSSSINPMNHLIAVRQAVASERTVGTGQADDFVPRQ